MRDRKIGRGIMFNIRLLKALNGDCIILSYGENEKYNILIDGGYGRSCCRELNSLVQGIKEKQEKINLLILTHIDFDHIEGILYLFSQKNFDFSVIEKMWFNFGKRMCETLNIDEKGKEIILYDNDAKISWRQGKDLEEKLKETSVEWEAVVKEQDVFFLGETKITVLSPTIEILKRFAQEEEKVKKKEVKISYEDDNECNKKIEEICAQEFEGNVTLANRSSIAILLEYKKLSLLFLGDAESKIIENSLQRLGYSKENKIKVNYCKVAHHASRHNTSSELIQMIDCSNYIISTQQGAHGRPNKECLSRIVFNSQKPVKFYFNYEINIDKFFSKEEIEKYKMQFVIMDEAGIILEET